MVDFRPLMVYEFGHEKGPKMRISEPLASGLERFDELAHDVAVSVGNVEPF